MQHILSADQFSTEDIAQLFKSTAEMRALVRHQGGSDRLRHKISANLFYEPSTRTSSSFTAAMYRLGGKVVSINDVQYSSVTKGETLEDTIRTLEQYADCIILRHPEVGAAKRAATVSSVPIINAGDGVGEHPTQSLLDLFTIFDEKQMIDGLTVTLVGDLKHGRTVHSLATLLNHYNVSLIFVSPTSLRFPSQLAAKLTNSFVEVASLEDALPQTDILYVTRVQKERFENLEEYEKVQNSYVIDRKILKKAKKDTTIMHPLPRVGEITFEIDVDPRAAYFRQMKNGMFLRMALLDMLLINNK